MSDKDIRFHCHGCAKPVTSPLPSDAVMRAIAWCPECIEAGRDQILPTPPPPSETKLGKDQRDRLCKAFDELEDATASWYIKAAPEQKRLDDPDVTKLRNVKLAARSSLESLFREQVEENERLRAIEKRVSDLGVKSINVEDGAVKMQLVASREVMTAIAHAATGMLNDDNDGGVPAENYVEMQFIDMKAGLITLTIQRHIGKTPHQKREEAEAELSALRSLQLTPEELEHIRTNWRPVALCQMCRDVIEKLRLISSKATSEEL